MVRRVLLATAVVCGAGPAAAAEYFVNAALGDDSFSGTMAAFVPSGCDGDGDTSDCTDGPWASLARVASQTLTGGDVVQLRCGDTWHEPLAILHSGEADNPILFTRYGAGCATARPTLDGTQAVANWQPDGGQADVFYSDDIGVATTQVFEDGARMTVARSPNAAAGGDPYRTITDESTEVSATLTARHYLIDSAYPSAVGADPVGAEVHIRNRRWRLQDRLITAYDGALGWLRWDDDTKSPAQTELTQCSVSAPCQYLDSRGLCGAVVPGFGYYLANLRWMLDVPGEWQQDASSGRLSVQLAPGVTPASAVFEASVVDHLVVADGQSHFVVEGLALRGARLDAVRVRNGSSFVIRDSVVADAGGSGMDLAFGVAGGDALIEGNIVSNSSTAAIRTSRGNNVTIASNTLTDTGNLDYANPEGLPYLSVGRGIGLSLSGDGDFLVADNLIQRSAYSGIQVGGSIPGTVLRGNRIDLSCSLLDDGGGLYIGGILDTVDDMEVIGNIISRSLGNLYGIPNTGAAAEGIYLDADAEGVTVRDNVVWNVAARGIFFHNALNNTATGNLLYGNGYEIGMHETYSEGTATDGTMFGNVIADNVLYHLGEGPALIATSIYDDFDQAFDFGAFSGNTYNGTHHDLVVRERYVNGATVSRDHTLAEWQSLRGQGSGSTLFRPFSFAPFQVTNLSGANLVFNGSFDSDAIGWGCWFPSKQTGDLCESPNPVMAWSADAGFNGGCLFGSGNASEQVLISSRNDLSVVADASYLVQFSTRSDVAAQRGTVSVRKTGASYDSLGLGASYRAGLLVDYHVYVPLVTESFDAARIDFSIPMNNSMMVDDVVVRAADIAHSDPGQGSALIVNLSAAPVALADGDVEMGTVTGGTFIGLDGQPIDWTSPLVSMYARIVVRADSPLLDTDSDGIVDSDDTCPNTPLVQTANVDGCSHYQLIGEPCTGVICDGTTPSPTCVDGQTLREFGAAACTDGVCQFSHVDTVCECSAGACVPPTDGGVDGGFGDPVSGDGDAVTGVAVEPSGAVSVGCACQSGSATWLLGLVLFVRRRKIALRPVRS